MKPRENFNLKEGNVYIDRTTLHAKFQFFQKKHFWSALFFVFKNPHWLTVCKVFGTQPNSLQLLFVFFFLKTWSISKLFFKPFVSFGWTWFLFCMFAKTPVYNIWYVFYIHKLMTWSTWDGNVGTFQYFLYFFEKHLITQLLWTFLEKSTTPIFTNKVSYER